MIAKLQDNPEHLVIESRATGGARNLFITAIVLTLGITLALVDFWALDWVTTRQAHMPGSWLYWYLLVPALVVACAPRLLTGTERLDLRDRSFIRTTWVAGIQTSRSEYELLTMKGLEAVVAVHPVPGVRTSIRFWYRSGFEYVGSYFDQAETESVIEHMVRYDIGVRHALGMDPAKGLADSAFWRTSEAREAMLQELYSRQHFLG